MDIWQKNITWDSEVLFKESNLSFYITFKVSGKKKTVQLCRIIKREALHLVVVFALLALNVRTKIQHYIVIPLYIQRGSIPNSTSKPPPFCTFGHFWFYTTRASNVDTAYTNPLFFVFVFVFAEKIKETK